MRTIDWRDGRVVIVDQTRLPAALRTLELTSVDELVDAIARLAVRGAPALGAAGALGVVLAVDQALSGRVGTTSGWWHSWPSCERPDPRRSTWRGGSIAPRAASPKDGRPC